MMQETDPNYPKDLFTAGMNLIKSQRAARERNLRVVDKNSANDKNGEQKPTNE
jgi:hypothetical protein